VGAVAARTQRIARPPWRPLVRAMSQTGGSSLASGLCSAIAAKILAVTVGPAPMAVLATLQQIRQATLAGATMNGQTALIQGASSLTGEARREFVRTVLILMSLATGVIALGIWIAPVWLGGLAGLGPESARLVRWLALTLVLSSAFVFLAAVLNIIGSLGSLAAVQLAGPATMALLAYPTAMSVRSGQSQAFAFLLLASASASLAAVLMALWRHEFLRGLGLWWNPSAARKFLTVSGSMLASGLISSAVLLIIRSRILRTEGLAVAGQFDSAWAISMNHVSLVLASMQAYYLPVLARTVPLKERNLHIAQTLTVAVLVAAPLIAAIAAFKPLALTWLYSEAFRGGAQYLRWTLIGDYLKITSWIFSIPMLAAADMRAFLIADLAAYGVFAGGAAALAQRKSASEGAAIAFVLMYAAHLGVCAAYAWRRQFRPDFRTSMVWTGGLALIGVVSAANWNSP